MDAEPTDGHDAHGDTEWRYTVTTDPGTGVIECKAWSRSYGADWRVAFKGRLVEFCTLYGARFGLPRLIDLCVKSWEGPRYVLATAPVARQLVARLRQMAAGYAETNPNRQDCSDRAEEWAAMLELSGEPVEG